MAGHGDQPGVFGGGRHPKRLIAAAYNYAAGSGDMPMEYELWLAIETFGAQAVLGRTIGAGEARRITAVKNVIAAYKSREGYRDENGAANWTEWAGKHRDAFRLLAWAEKVVDDGE